MAGVVFVGEWVPGVGDVAGTVRVARAIMDRLLFGVIRHDELVGDWHWGLAIYE